MDLLHKLSHLILWLIIIKFIAWIIILLFSYFGRKIGIGPKFSSENGEYAVINGATGLLGKEFAYEFASMGYNLVLISKNAQRVNKLEQKLRKKCPLMKNVVKIEANYTKMDNYPSIKSKLDSIPLITALINCTGYCVEPKTFHDLSTEDKQNMILVNVMAPTMLMDMLLPRFIKQNQGIIINVGSQSGDFRFPFYSVFSATKSYIHTLTEICNTESAHGNVYIQNLKPCFVSSGSANKKNELRSTFFKASANHVSYTSLMTLGTESSTYGHYRHRLSGLIFDILVFIFGHRMTTEFSKCFMNAFVKLDKNSRSDSSLTSVRTSADSITTKTSVHQDRSISLTPVPPTVPPRPPPPPPPQPPMKQIKSQMSDMSSDSAKSDTEHIHIELEIPPSAPNDNQQHKEPQPVAKVLMVKTDGHDAELPKVYLNDEELNLKQKMNTLSSKINSKSVIKSDLNGKSQIPKSTILSKMDSADLKSGIPNSTVKFKGDPIKSLVAKLEKNHNIEKSNKSKSLGVLSATSKQEKSKSISKLKHSKSAEF